MIKVYLNRKVSETQITIGNQYESGVNAIDFDLSELKQKWPNGNIYLLVSRKKHTWPYSIDDGEFKVEYVLTWKRGFYQMNVVVTDEKITDQLESSNTIFVSDTINAYVNENQINAKALNEQELPRELQIVYDDLITLKKNIEKDLADGKYIGPQGPKGEPGDVTEEYRNLASQIAQNASDAQTSATNAQVSATNAQKALDDTKDFVNQTKTELNQIKTDTRALKDEANTSAVNAQASATSAQESATNASQSATSAQESATSAQESATSAQESATNAQKILDDTKTFANQAISEVNQIKTDTNTLKDEANTSAVNAKASETKAKEYADNLKESTDTISQNIKAISELADKKITKFYASNQGETHVSDSDNGIIQDMKIYGKSSQVKTTGKNLLKIKNTTNTTRGITITSKDGIITVNGTATETGYALLEIDTLMVTDGTYIVNYEAYNHENSIQIALLNAKYNRVIEQNVATSLSNVEISKIAFFIHEGKTYDIKDVKIQLELGSVATSYEPYTGGQPSPNPDYPQEIKSVVNPTIKVIGKNLIEFDESFNGNQYGINMIYEKGGIRITGTATSNGNVRIINPDVKKIKWNKNKYTVSLKSEEEADCVLNIAEANNAEWKIVASARVNQTTTFEKAIETVGVFITFSEGKTYDLLVYPQVEYGTQATEYEPYKEQSVTLPITLNAIPVSSGGNVTINGQQYVSDYIDVERGKVVRCVKREPLSKNGRLSSGSSPFYTYNLPSAKPKAITEVFALCNLAQFNSIMTSNSRIGISSDGSNSLRMRLDGYATLEQYTRLSAKIIYELATPIEEDLTSEQIETLKMLSTYYPVTNITVGSEELDGYTVFNYPISLANGWNYVKKQLNDNRDYIYDMDLQSAEAYVNSEYAVTLTELEV